MPPQQVLVPFLDSENNNEHLFLACRERKKSLFFSLYSDAFADNTVELVNNYHRVIFLRASLEPSWRRKMFIQFHSKRNLVGFKQAYTWLMQPRSDSCKERRYSKLFSGGYWNLFGQRMLLGTRGKGRKQKINKEGKNWRHWPSKLNQNLLHFHLENDYKLYVIKISGIKMLKIEQNKPELNFLKIRIKRPDMKLSEIFLLFY